MVRAKKALIGAALSALAASTSVSASPFSPSRAASAISLFYKNNPYKGAFLTCSVKGCTADLVAQYLAASKASKKEREEESKQSKLDRELSRLNPLRKARGGDLASSAASAVGKRGFALDLRRSLVFLIYGGCYQGCCNEYIYNRILPRLGTGTDVRTVAKKVAADMGFFCPVLCIPMAYVVKGLLRGRSIRASYASYLDDVVHKGVLLKNWMIFVPAQCLTFSVVPRHFRVSFVAGVSFFWMIILSSILGEG